CLEEMRLQRSFKIFATDVDKEAINFAAEAIYPENIAADVEPHLLDRYFQQRNNSYQVQKTLRERVVFAAHDALQDPPFIHMDLISCRNMPIYLNPQMQQNLFRNFQFALNFNGYLFLGPSETVGASKKAFELVDSKWKIYKNVSPTKLGHITGNRQYFRERAYAADGEQHNAPFAGQLHRGLELIFTTILAQRYAPRAVFVNENLEILHLNGDFDELLQFPRVTKMMLPEVIGENDDLIFRNGIRKVEKTGKPMIYKNIPFRKRDKNFRLDLLFEKCSPKELNGVNIFLIEFRITGENKPDRSSQTPEEISLDKYKDERLVTLELELQKVRLEKQSLIEQLETTNEELQSSNEELLAANEELQSTNEELQSLNEELYTVNSELQSKIDELTEVHNDTNNLLKSTEIGTIFLDMGLRIRKCTPALQEQFHLLDSDVGRPITHFTNAFNGTNIYEDIQKVLKDLSIIERRVTDNEGNRYLMRILPYYTEENVINGAVVTFVNINKLLMGVVEMEESEQKFKTLFEHSYNQIALVDGQGIVLSYNFHLDGCPGWKVGKPLLKFLLPENRPMFQEALSKVKDGNGITSLVHRNREKGKDYWFTTRFAPVFLQNQVQSVALITEALDGEPVK
ncbi:MAG: CheR family methyltransferase, partial [Bacteroidota bacterium]